MVFPDYSTQVQKNRRSYNKVKQKLRALGIRYMLMFPAKLKVIYQGKVLFFVTSESAWDWAMETPNVKPNQNPPWGSAQSPEGYVRSARQHQIREDQRSVSRRRKRSSGETQLDPQRILGDRLLDQRIEAAASDIQQSEDTGD